MFRNKLARLSSNSNTVKAVHIAWNATPPFDPVGGDTGVPLVWSDKPEVEQAEDDAVHQRALQGRETPPLPPPRTRGRHCTTGSHHRKLSL